MASTGLTPVRSTIWMADRVAYCVSLLKRSRLLTTTGSNPVPSSIRYLHTVVKGWTYLGCLTVCTTQQLYISLQEKQHPVWVKTGGSMPAMYSGVVFLGSSMVEHLAVNQRVASSSLAPRAMSL